MTSVFARDQSRTLTTYSQGHPLHHRKETFSIQLKDFWLRKSMFDPPEGLAEAYAARRHIAGVEVPPVEIVYCNSRWLLLQAPKAQPIFFEKLNKGRLGLKEEQILKVFKGFVALAKLFGFFRPTEKMIFLENGQVRVWVNQDIFGIVPSMPISRGIQGEKHFVIAFLALVQTCLVSWERVSSITTINDALRLFEKRCKLAQQSKAALKASKQVHYRPEESQCSQDVGDFLLKKATSSHRCSKAQTEKQETPRLSYTFTKLTGLSDLSKHISKIKQIRSSIQIRQENENQASGSKKKFALNSTSSTIGNFSEKFRTTAGRKKLMEKIEEQAVQPEQPAEQQPVSQMNNIQMQFQGLFEEEVCDESELERIAEEMEQVLIW